MGGIIIMAGNTNIVFIEGRLTRDPSLSKTKSDKSICKFSLANNQYYYTENKLNNAVSYFNFVSWGNLAERSASKLHKGSHIFITGEIKESRYISKTGDKKSSIYILVLDIKYLDRNYSSNYNIATSETFSEKIINDSVIDDDLEIDI